MTKKKMSEEEKKQWDELYSYVKELMGYDDKTLSHKSNIRSNSI